MSKLVGIISLALWAISATSVQAQTIENYCIKESTDMESISAILFQINTKAKNDPKFHLSYSPTIEFTQDLKIKLKETGAILQHELIQMYKTINNFCTVQIYIFSDNKTKKNIIIKKGYKIDYLKASQFVASKSDYLIITDNKNLLRFDIKASNRCSTNEVSQYLKSVGLKLDIFSAKDSPECKETEESEEITGDIIDATIQESSSVGV